MLAAKHNDVPHCHVHYADGLGQVQQQAAPPSLPPPPPSRDKSARTSSCKQLVA